LFAKRSRSNYIRRSHRTSQLTSREPNLHRYTCPIRSFLNTKDPTPPISPNKSNHSDNSDKSHKTQSEGSVHSGHSEQIEHSVHSKQSNKSTHSEHSDKPEYSEHSDNSGKSTHSEHFDQSSESNSSVHSKRSEYESLHIDRSQEGRVPSPPSPRNQLHSDTQYHTPRTTDLRVKIPQHEPPLFNSLINTEFFKLDPDLLKDPVVVDVLASLYCTPSKVGTDHFPHDLSLPFFFANSFGNPLQNPLRTPFSPGLMAATPFFNPQLSPPKYSSITSPSCFIGKFDSNANIFSLTEDQKLSILPFQLEGPAKSWYSSHLQDLLRAEQSKTPNSVLADIKPTWAALTVSLIESFKDADAEEHLENRLRSVVFNPRLPEAYYYEMQGLMDKLRWTNVKKRIRTLIKYLPPDIGNMLALRGLKDEEELIQALKDRSEYDSMIGINHTPKVAEESPPSRVKRGARINTLETHDLERHC